MAGGTAADASASAPSLDPAAFARWAATLAPAAAPDQAASGSWSKLFFGAVVLALAVLAAVTGPRVVDFLAPLGPLALVVPGLWGGAVLGCAVALARNPPPPAATREALTAEAIQAAVFRHFGFEAIEADDVLTIETWRRLWLVPATGFKGFRRAFMGPWRGRRAIVADAEFLDARRDCRVAIVALPEAAWPDATVMSRWSDDWAPHERYDGTGARPPGHFPATLPGLDALGYGGSVAPGAAFPPALRDGPIAAWLEAAAESAAALPQLGAERARLLAALPLGDATAASAADAAEEAAACYRRLSPILSLIESVNRAYPPPPPRQDRDHA